MSISSTVLRLSLMAALLCAASHLLSQSQVPATIGRQLPTDQRVRLERWWPTKGTFKRDDYAGPAACAGCHSSIYRLQSRSAMASTSSDAADSEVLKTHNPVEFRHGPYQYKIVRNGSVENLSVTDGAQSIIEPLGWSFGGGLTGQSYLMLRRGEYVEARLSYLASLNSFEITPGQSTSPAASVEKAIGHRLTEDETVRCFICHTTAAVTSSKFDLKTLVHGVTCEACHGPGADHVLLRSGPAAAQLSRDDDPIFRASRLSPADSVDFCGSCHRTWWDAMALGFTGVMNVRFPAYGLERSRCWGNGDARLTCVACHDPHASLNRDAEAYDARCLRCHTQKGMQAAGDHPGAACPKATKACVTCHMPKFELPGMHLTFTDHQIRVVRPGEHPQG